MMRLTYRLSIVGSDSVRRELWPLVVLFRDLPGWRGLGRVVLACFRLPVHPKYFRLVILQRILLWLWML